jgi:hypothetical protein
VVPLNAVFAGAALAAAAALGAWAGWDWRDARAGRDGAQQERAQSEYLARNFVSRAVAEAQYAALSGRAAKVLREVIHVPAEPLQCPPGVDVRDVVLPGLADRLRQLRDVTGVDPAAGLAPVQF